MAVTGSSPSSRTRDLHCPLTRIDAGSEPLASEPNSGEPIIGELPYHHNELAKLATLSRALISTIDLEQLLGNVADEIIKVVGMTRCCIYMYDHSRRVYGPRVWRGYHGSISRNPVRERAGVIGEVGRERRMLYYDGCRDAENDAESDPKLARRNRQRHGFLRGHLLSTVLRRINVPENERLQILEHFKQVLESGQSVYQYKLTASLGSDGRAQKTLSVNLSRLTYLGEAYGVVLSLEHVTQEVTLMAQLERIRRLADISQLAAKMAHEVRNALSPIKGAAQIIRFDLESQGATTEWPDMIIAEVDGLSRLTSTMLDFARPIPLDLRQFSPYDFITGCITSLSSFLDEHAVIVQWQIERDLPDMVADPVQLGQAVRNVVMNAAQSMANGCVLVIELGQDLSDHTIVMRFRDSGVGIAEAEKESIFRPLVTTKPKGTGLGLPIVHKIVSMHGGRVEVESSLGEGSCFILSLPLTQPATSVDMSADSAPLISAQSGRFPDN